LNTINVAFAFYDNYAQHTTATICSILEHNINKRPYHFYLYVPDISSSNKERIQEFIQSYHCLCTWINPPETFNIEEITQKLEAKFPNLHFNVTAFFTRILFQEFLPDNVEKIIALDSDIIVLSDLSEIYDIDLKDKILGAVPEDISKNHLKEISFQKSDIYFNSGVMLINLKKWKTHSVSNQLLQIALDKQNHFSLYDQDALNIYFKNSFLPLSKKFNQMVYMFNIPSLISKIKYKYRYINGIGQSGIIHYTGTKPWKFECLHPYKSLYFTYLNKTPYKDYKLEVNKEKRLFEIINAYYIGRKLLKIVRKLS
jgi:lipopolysaccharide biosynthesis glycosyltransferase